jgi:diguanylate cyclase (GGDEF)-like protein
MNPPELLTALKRMVEQLAAFNDIAKALVSTLDRTEVLDVIGSRLSALLGAQSWSLLLRGDDGRLHFEVAQGPGAEALKGQSLAPGEGIAGAVYQSSHSRVVADAAADPDFHPRYDGLTGTQTGSILAVPLRVRGTAVGVLELVAPVGQRPFSQDDLRAASAVADFAAIAIDNARNFQRVQELTLVDEHTGLFNARHLMDQLEHEVARSARFARPVSLLFLDLDDFKSVNDTYGHLVGSGALRHVGKILTSITRAVDSAYRYGGDEFAVVLVETGVDGSGTVASKLLDAFARMPYEFDARVEGAEAPPERRSLVLRASVGVATFPGDGTTARALIDSADRAMYRAKREGKFAWRRLSE